MFRTIVAGTDAGEKGRNAVVLAHELAWATGARLLLVAVRPHGAAQPVDLVRRLRALRNELAPEALVLTVPGASPADALLRVADEQGGDLIVVGARERSRLRRVVEGEPGMKVLRGGQCAVAVAPDDAPAPRRLGRIGVCVDDLSDPGPALDLADSVARCAGGRVTTFARGAAVGQPDLLVLGAHDAGDVRRLVRDVRCPVLVPPRDAWQPWAFVAAQTSAART